MKRRWVDGWRWATQLTHYPLPPHPFFLFTSQSRSSELISGWIWLAGGRKAKKETWKQEFWAALSLLLIDRRASKSLVVIGNWVWGRIRKTTMVDSAHGYNRILYLSLSNYQGKIDNQISGIIRGEMDSLT